MNHELTRRCLAAFIGAFVFVSRPPMASAQASPTERYARAADNGDFRGAADVLVEALRATNLSDAERRTMRGALAVALIRAHDLTAAREAATVCREPSPPVACSAVSELAELAAEPPSTPVAPEASAPAAATAPALPVAAPSPPAAPPVIRLVLTPTRSWSPSPGPVALWSVGAASLAAAGVLAVLRADALGPCTTRGNVASCPDTQSLDRARTVPMLSTGTNVALGLGVAAVAAGSLWYVLGGRALVPTVTAEGATLAISGRW